MTSSHSITSCATSGAHPLPLTADPARQGWSPSLRYPDPAVVALDDSFLALRVFAASVERLATGLRWAEGPVWFGDGRYLLCSDIPNNRVLRWDEATGQVSTFREPSNFANGHTRDAQGRLLTCEGSVTRRITRTEYSGRVTVLVDNYKGKRFNSPNDIVCQRNGVILFSDPIFQINNNYEGELAESELPVAFYRFDPGSGAIDQVVTDLQGPNGLCFSPDEKTLYLVESRAMPHRRVWAYDVSSDGRLSNKRLHLDAAGPGAFDGIKCDVDGNIWAGFGSNGSAGADPAVLDGVRVFNREGRPIGHVHLPERCANLCFGGEKGNRLFMAASHSIYSLYVNTVGADMR